MGCGAPEYRVISKLADIISLENRMEGAVGVVFPVSGPSAAMDGVFCVSRNGKHHTYCGNKDQ